MSRMASCSVLTRLLYVAVVTGWLAVSLVQAESKSHPITTQLSAKWKITPLQLEIAEFIDEERGNSFWEYVELLNNVPGGLHGLETEEKRYLKSIELASEILGQGQISLLKLALSLHSFSPKVQAHLQVAQEVLTKGDCETSIFASVHGKVACDISELESILRAGGKDAATVETFAIDHIYPGSENNTLTVVLYGEIGTPEFKQFHQVIRPVADRGTVRYVLRHYVQRVSSRKLRLSGYGVELHLKSTEYKSQDDSQHAQDPVAAGGADEDDGLESEVEGFDFAQLKKRFPHLVHSLDRFRNSLLEKHDEIAPLKAWEFQELGLQAARRIVEMPGDEALKMLQFTAQNFPTQAKSLLSQTVSEEFKKEMRNNIEVFGRNLNLQPPDAALFLNGLFFDAETIDTITLLDTLRSEMRVLEGLNRIEIRGRSATPLLGLDLSSSSKEFAIDVRDSAITWINDLENDAQYRRWPASLKDLLRPTFPGMLRNIRKNLFNLVLIVDPVAGDSAGRDIVKLAESFVVHMAPVRVGLVFQTGDGEDYRAVTCGFNYVHQKKSATEALGFLTDLFAATADRKVIRYADVRDVLRKKFNRLKLEEVDEILGEDSDFDYGRQLAQEFIARLGLKTVPQALLNGVLLPQSALTSDEFEETILTEIMQQTPTLQKAVYMGDLHEGEPVIDYLMKQPHVMPRLNQRILSQDEPHFLDMSGRPHPDLEDISALGQLSNADLTATLMSNLKYFGGKSTYERFLGQRVHFLTVWVVGDLRLSAARKQLRNALLFMKSTSGLRVAFVPNVDGSDAARSELKKDLNALVWASINTLDADETYDLVMRLLEAAEAGTDLATVSVPDSVLGFLPATQMHLKMLRVYCQRVLKLRASVSTVMANGRLLGAFEAEEYFDTEDYGLLDSYNGLQYTDKIRAALKQASLTENVDTPAMTSDTIMKLVSILVPRQQSKSRYTIPTDVQENHTVVQLAPKEAEQPFFEIVAVLDPASRGAQKLSSLLLLLRDVVNCQMKIFLCAIDKHSDMPVKTFYRFVVDPELHFTNDGRLSAGPIAKFVGLPANPLLTQSLNVPENWLVEVVRSVYDLDNIKLSEINGPVHSEYELEYLLLEGHCFDSATGSPPRGLQITLGTEDRPIIVDTIVMANLGYFQLKANPGAWILKLRHGKSADIYDITSADGPNTVHTPESTRVIISSLRSHVLKLRVTKKPGMAGFDLLGDEKDGAGGGGGGGGGIWDSISSIVGTGDSGNTGGSASEGEVLNIFSVASGHLYERLLRIMMLSLLKHTHTPVKFWFLKNYLSPQFIDFLPHMSAEYGFQYELVQYKWPRWLHQQTEKQRIIWGYKILFLDVLFPLDVKKIIFVDADQIVRADMKELNDFDLGGAPYGYTPFCDSRQEMEGFRFWKQGYWKNHLQGRRYHISALYVVDLKRFRKIAAGDRIRGQYQALSQDPNSLSNLDQDLPNNMIHQVAIKSLPQEWLWCETWCSSETLQYAKTIDLCNNPLTKEAKLTAAQRIVPEWKDYDAEIKRLQAKADEIEHAGGEAGEQETSSSGQHSTGGLAEEQEDITRSKHTEL
ncbi:UDP-glucose:glycoprotein glucosyltransferase [Anopheles aquasalis]|uniref:UDP-glucose:glycoprotein glucosyltransferase n=1 Tax=Anopheles aquasalis TaxID=42839 RepID=UPI00215B278F|nr:UDP-glucose:glycoprotein glucosyltransferase [Anopheles aquasalis]